MSEHIVAYMSVWELISNLSLSLMIGSEAFAVIGAVAWAFLYYTGLFKVAVYGGLAIGASAGIVSAIWMFRLALKQRRIQALEREKFATMAAE